MTDRPPLKCGPIELLWNGVCWKFYFGRFGLSVGTSRIKPKWYVMSIQFTGDNGQQVFAEIGEYSTTSEAVKDIEQWLADMADTLEPWSADPTHDEESDVQELKKQNAELRAELEIANEAAEEDPSCYARARALRKTNTA